MASKKKYQINIEKNKQNWVAQITRQVTSRKKIVTKQKEGFSTETEAQSWAEQTLAEFIQTQQKTNERQGANRRANENIKSDRSSRRAEKALAAKAEKEKLKTSFDENTDHD